MKNISSLRVLAVHPPGEIQKQFVEDAFEKFQVALVVFVRLAADFPIHLKHAPRRPRVDGRVHVAERPFIGGQLAVRVHEPFAREQIELPLGELRVHKRERDAVERQVPRGIPRVFPFVRHGNDVSIVQVRPVNIAHALAFWRRWRLRGIAVEPRPHVEPIKLFRPDHAGERLPLDGTQIGIVQTVLQVGIKLIRLGEALRKNGVKLREWFGGGLAR